MHQTDTGITN